MQPDTRPPGNITIGAQCVELQLLVQLCTATTIFAFSGRRVNDDHLTNSFVRPGVSFFFSCASGLKAPMKLSCKRPTERPSSMSRQIPVQARRLCLTLSMSLYRRLCWLAVALD